MTEIKSRIDGNGVGWCDAGCPQEDGHEFYDCAILEINIAHGEVCPIHTARMAAENKAMRELLRLILHDDEVFLSPGQVKEACALLGEEE